MASLSGLKASSFNATAHQQQQRVKAAGVMPSVAPRRAGVAAVAASSSAAAPRHSQSHPQQHHHHHHHHQQQQQRLVACAASATDSADAETIELELKVEGMVCGACSARVEEALKAAPKVRGAKADLESKLVAVDVEAPTMMDALELMPGYIKIVQEAGFEAAPHLP